jgi:beta-galactosidase
LGRENGQFLVGVAEVMPLVAARNARDQAWEHLKKLVKNKRYLSNFPKQKTVNLHNTTAFFLVVLTFNLCCASTVKAERTNVDLATDWKFIKQDVDPAAPTENWDAVTIPHIWNNLDAQKGVKGNPTLQDGYFRGACWYARMLDVPAAWQGKRVFIRFEAASIVADIYLNGESIGEHRGAFAAFCFELTSHLKFGWPNELRVRVDNSNQLDVPPLSGDFNMDGGIYRPVKLIVTDEACITPLDFASPGVLKPSSRWTTSTPASK